MDIPIVLAEKSNTWRIRTKRFGNVLDVGAQQIDVGYSLEKRIIYTNSIDVGGDNITNDISIVLEYL